MYGQTDPIKLHAVGQGRTLWTASPLQKRYITRTRYLQFPKKRGYSIGTMSLLTSDLINGLAILKHRARFDHIQYMLNLQSKQGVYSMFIEMIARSFPVLTGLNSREPRHSDAH